MRLETEALKRLMALKYYDVPTLAKKVGVSRQSAYMWLWGKSQPRPNMLRKLCDVLECSPDDLIQKNMSWYVVVTMTEYDDQFGNNGPWEDWVGPFATMEEAKANESRAVRQRAYDWDEITKSYECRWDKVTSKVMQMNSDVTQCEVTTWQG